jgi:hypothetical protein
MSNWFILICYILALYGFSDIITQSMGPGYIFLKIRLLAERISPNLGMLFKCMWCFPTNAGIAFSLLNWFFLPIYISPFNMIFADYHNLWYMSLVAALLDGCFTGAICALIFNVYDYVDKSTPIFEDDNDNE